MEAGWMWVRTGWKTWEGLGRGWGGGGGRANELGRVKNDDFDGMNTKRTLFFLKK